MKKFFAIAGLLPCVFSTEVYAHDKSHGEGSTKKDGLTIGGFIDFQGGYADQDVVRDNRRDYHFLNDTEIHLGYSQTSSSGIRYGAVIELEADVNEDFNEEGTNADKTYLFIETNAGRLEMGSNSDAGHRLQVDASSFARATGGIHGDWIYHTFFPGEEGGHGHGHDENPALTGHDDFVHAPALPLHHSHGATEDATKITYFTPQTNGFQAGFSYIPDSGDTGTASGFTGKSGHRDYNDVINAGVSYDGKIGEVGIKTSLTGETGRAELPGHANLQAWAAGINAEYSGLVVGGSYGDWDESLTHSHQGNPTAHYYTLGAGYGWDKTGVSVTYLNSTYQDNDANVLSFGADYTPLPGLTPYVELSLVDMDADDPTVQDNEATVFIIGTQLNF